MCVFSNEDLFVDQSVAGHAGITTPHRIDILLAEPDEAVRDSMQVLFETVGFAVESARDAGQVEALLLQQPPRCLVLASEFTPHGGIALLSQLREHGFNVPAIITACRGGVPLAVEAMRAGATDFLEKPLLDARLLLAVKRVMNQ